MPGEVTVEGVLASLRKRQALGGVRLSYAQADWLIALLERPPVAVDDLTLEQRRVLIDQAKRKRLLEDRAHEYTKGQKRITPPVIDVPLKERKTEMAA